MPAGSHVAYRHHLRRADDIGHLVNRGVVAVNGYRLDLEIVFGSRINLPGSCSSIDDLCIIETICRVELRRNDALEMRDIVSVPAVSEILKEQPDVIIKIGRRGELVEEVSLE